MLLIGLVGGAALGSAAAARRTASSFPVFLASTNPSDLTVEYATTSYAGLPAFARTVVHLPEVRRAEIAVEPIANVLQRDGAPTSASMSNGLGVAGVGSVDGLYFNQDRVTATRGRMANPRRADQFVMSAGAARLLGLHVGSVVPLGFYTNAQSESPAYGTARVRPTVRIEATLVGLAEFNNEVVQDDVDRTQGYMLFTPALTRVLLAAGTSSGIAWYGLQLDRGASDVAAVEREINNQIRTVPPAEFHVAALNEAQAQSAIEPDWIALAVFALIAALATLVIAVQAIARQLREQDDDVQVLRALGAGPAMTAAGSLIGILGAVVVGSLLAAGVAVALSPIGPIGPVRPVYPTPGFAFDWTVLGLGLLVLIGGLGATAAVLARRHTPRRGRWPGRVAGPQSSRVPRLAPRRAARLPATVITAGVRLSRHPTAAQRSASTLSRHVTRG